MDLDHAVPGAVRLEVIQAWIRDGVSLDEGAEVGKVRSRAICIDAKDGVIGPSQPVRATGTSLHPIEDAIDELDVRYPARQAPRSCTCLTRRQLVDHGGTLTSSIDLGDTGSEATRIWSDGRGDLHTL